MATTTATQDFPTALLTRMGFPLTDENIRLVKGWHGAEGGDSAERFNWLNSNLGDRFPAINSVNVRAYPDFDTGIDYTARSIGDNFPRIRAALASGMGLSALGAEDEWLKWSGGDKNYARNVAANAGAAAPRRQRIGDLLQDGEGNPLVSQLDRFTNKGRAVLNFELPEGLNDQERQVILSQVATAIPRFTLEAYAGRHPMAQAHETPAVEDPQAAQVRELYNRSGAAFRLLSQAAVGQANVVPSWNDKPYGGLGLAPGQRPLTETLPPPKTFPEHVARVVGAVPALTVETLLLRRIPFLAPQAGVGVLNAGNAARAAATGAIVMGGMPARDASSRAISAGLGAVTFPLAEIAPAAVGQAIVKRGAAGAVRATTEALKEQEASLVAKAAAGGTPLSAADRALLEQIQAQGGRAAAATQRLAEAGARLETTANIAASATSAATSAVLFGPITGYTQQALLHATGHDVEMPTTDDLFGPDALRNMAALTVAGAVGARGRIRANEPTYEPLGRPKPGGPESAGARPGLPPGPVAPAPVPPRQGNIVEMMAPRSPEARSALGAVRAIRAGFDGRPANPYAGGQLPRDLFDRKFNEGVIAAAAAKGLAPEALTAEDHRAIAAKAAAIVNGYEVIRTTMAPPQIPLSDPDRTRKINFAEAATKRANELLVGKPLTMTLDVPGQKEPVTGPVTILRAEVWPWLRKDAVRVFLRDDVSGRTAALSFDSVEDLARRLKLAPSAPASAEPVARLQTSRMVPRVGPSPTGEGLAEAALSGRQVPPTPKPLPRAAETRLNPETLWRGGKLAIDELVQPENAHTLWSAVRIGGPLPKRAAELIHEAQVLGIRIKESKIREMALRNRDPKLFTQALQRRLLNGLEGRVRELGRQPTARAPREGAAGPAPAPPAPEPSPSAPPEKPPTPPASSGGGPPKPPPGGGGGTPAVAPPAPPRPTATPATPASKVEQALAEVRSRTAEGQKKLEAERQRILTGKPPATPATHYTRSSGERVPIRTMASPHLRNAEALAPAGPEKSAMRTEIERRGLAPKEAPREAPKPAAPAQPAAAAKPSVPTAGAERPAPLRPTPAPGPAPAGGRVGEGGRGAAPPPAAEAKEIMASAEGATAAPRETSNGTRIISGTIMPDPAPANTYTPEKVAATEAVLEASYKKAGVPTERRIKLMEHQIHNVGMAMQAFDTGNAIAIADSTGTGKTVTGILIALEAEKRFGDSKNVLVAPNSGILEQWRREAAMFGLEIEQIRTSSIAAPAKGKLVAITYASLMKRKGDVGFNPDLVIFDEAHKGIGGFNPGAKFDEQPQSASAMQLARSAKHKAYLTATPMSTPLDFAYLGEFMPAAYPSFNAMLTELGVRFDFGESRWYGLTPKKLLDLHEKLVRAGVYTRTELIPDNIKNRWGEPVRMYVTPVMVGVSAETASKYNRAADLIDAYKYELKRKRMSAGARVISAQRTAILRAIIEEGRVQDAIRIGDEKLAQGYSLAYFVERLEGGDFGNKESDSRYVAELWGRLGKAGISHASPVDLLRDYYLKRGIRVSEITGKTPAGSTSRQAGVDAFQAGESKVAVVTFAAGGTGLSLHDLIGNHPRFGILIQTPYDANTGIQTLGRLFRLGSQTNAQFTVLSSPTPTDKKYTGRFLNRVKAAGYIVRGDESQVGTHTDVVFEYEKDMPDRISATTGMTPEQVAERTNAFAFDKAAADARVAERQARAQTAPIPGEKKAAAPKPPKAVKETKPARTPEEEAALKKYEGKFVRPVSDDPHQQFFYPSTIGRVTDVSTRADGELLFRVEDEDFVGRYDLLTEDTFKAVTREEAEAFVAKRDADIDAEATAEAQRPKPVKSAKKAAPIPTDQQQQRMAEVLTMVNEDPGNATLIPRGMDATFEALLEADGWVATKIGKGDYWVKGDRELFIRGQGKENGSIVQWDINEPEAQAERSAKAVPKAEPTPKAPSKGLFSRESLLSDVEPPKKPAKKLEQGTLAVGPPKMPTTAIATPGPAPVMPLGMEAKTFDEAFEQLIRGGSPDAEAAFEAGLVSGQPEPDGFDAAAAARSIRRRILEEQGQQDMFGGALMLGSEGRVGSAGAPAGALANIAERPDLISTEAVEREVGDKKLEAATIRTHEDFQQRDVGANLINAENLQKLLERWGGYSAAEIKLHPPIVWLDSLGELGIPGDHYIIDGHHRVYIASHNWAKDESTGKWVTTGPSDRVIPVKVIGGSLAVAKENALLANQAGIANTLSERARIADSIGEKQAAVKLGVSESEAARLMNFYQVDADLRRTYFPPGNEEAFASWKNGALLGAHVRSNKALFTKAVQESFLRRMVSDGLNQGEFKSAIEDWTKQIAHKLPENMLLGSPNATQIMPSEWGAATGKLVYDVDASIAQARKTLTGIIAQYKPAGVVTLKAGASAGAMVKFLGEHSKELPPHAVATMKDIQRKLQQLQAVRDEVSKRRDSLLKKIISGQSVAEDIAAIKAYVTEKLGPVLRRAVKATDDIAKGGPLGSGFGAMDPVASWFWRRVMEGRKAAQDWFLRRQGRRAKTVYVKVEGTGETVAKYEIKPPDLASEEPLYRVGATSNLMGAMMTLPPGLQNEAIVAQAGRDYLSHMAYEMFIEAAGPRLMVDAPRLDPRAAGLTDALENKDTPQGKAFKAKYPEELKAIREVFNQLREMAVKVAKDEGIKPPGFIEHYFPHLRGQPAASPVDDLARFFYGRDLDEKEMRDVRNRFFETREGDEVYQRDPWIGIEAYIRAWARWMAMVPYLARAKQVLSSEWAKGDPQRAEATRNIVREMAFPDDDIATQMMNDHTRSLFYVKTSGGVQTITLAEAAKYLKKKPSEYSQTYDRFVHVRKGTKVTFTNPRAWTKLGEAEYGTIYGGSSGHAFNGDVPELVPALERALRYSTKLRLSRMKNPRPETVIAEVARARERVSRYQNKPASAAMAWFSRRILKALIGYSASSIFQNSTQLLTHVMPEYGFRAALEGASRFSRASKGAVMRAAADYFEHLKFIDPQTAAAWRASAKYYPEELYPEAVGTRHGQSEVQHDLARRIEEGEHALDARLHQLLFSSLGAYGVIETIVRGMSAMMASAAAVRLGHSQPEAQRMIEADGAARRRATLDIMGSVRNPKSVAWFMAHHEYFTNFYYNLLGQNIGMAKPWFRYIIGQLSTFPASTLVLRELRDILGITKVAVAGVRSVFGKPGTPPKMKGSTQASGVYEAPRLGAREPYGGSKSRFGSFFQRGGASWFARWAAKSFLRTQLVAGVLLMLSDLLKMNLLGLYTPFSTLGILALLRQFFPDNAFLERSMKRAESGLVYRFIGPYLGITGPIPTMWARYTEGKSVGDILWNSTFGFLGGLMRMLILGPLHRAARGSLETYPEVFDTDNLRWTYDMLGQRSALYGLDAGQKVQNILGILDPDVVEAARRPVHPQGDALLPALPQAAQ